MWVVGQCGCPVPSPKARIMASNVVRIDAYEHRASRRPDRYRWDRGPVGVPVIDVHDVGEVVVVLFDPDSRPSKFGEFANLVAFDRRRRLAWRAELLTTNSADRYYQIRSAEPLIADSSCSYECQLDPRSGRIVAKEFYK